jgi:Uma2 family endonuclease
MNAGSIPAEWLPQYTQKDYEKWEGDWELINGFPYALSPSPNFKHQKLGSQFIFLATTKLQQLNTGCNCQVVYELDWVINDLTIIRPDVMIVCDVVPVDFLRTPPVLALEIFSPASRLKDRNLKFKIYEENGVKYYLMADPEKNSLEAFVLKNNRFEEYQSSSFQLTSSCSIELDLTKIWQ